MNTIRAVVIFPGYAIVSEVGPDGYREIDLRTHKGYDAFAARLGELLGVKASVFDGAGLPQPGGGTLVLCPSDGLYALRMNGAGPLEDVVLLDATRIEALRECEALGLAAAVESDPYADWATGHACVEPSLFGRLDVAVTLGVRLYHQPPTQGQHYGRFQIPGVTEFAELLTLYVNAYSRAK